MVLVTTRTSPHSRHARTAFFHTCQRPSLSQVIPHKTCTQQLLQRGNLGSVLHTPWWESWVSWCKQAKPWGDYSNGWVFLHTHLYILLKNKHWKARIQFFTQTRWVGDSRGLQKTVAWCFFKYICCWRPEIGWHTQFLSLTRDELEIAEGSKKGCSTCLVRMIICMFIIPKMLRFSLLQHSWHTETDSTMYQDTPKPAGTYQTQQKLTHVHSLSCLSTNLYYPHPRSYPHPHYS